MKGTRNPDDDDYSAETEDRLIARRSPTTGEAQYEAYLDRIGEGES
jgi:hypothetical protein